MDTEDTSSHYTVYASRPVPSQAGTRRPSSLGRIAIARVRQIDDGINDTCSVLRICPASSVPLRSIRRRTLGPLRLEAKS